MKLNHLVPALAFIIAFGGCAGKSKNHAPKEQTVQYEKKPEDEKKTDDKTNDYTTTNQPTITNRTEVDKTTNEEDVVISNFNTTATIFASSNSSMVVTDSTSGYTGGNIDSKYNPLTSTGTTIGNDGVRKFIKTADLKFRVRSVIQSTYDIEDITHRFGGFVAHTNLESRIDNVISTPVSSDSTLETTYYTIVNSLLIRVPEQKMDSALRAMAPLVDYMDHRRIEVEDVHIQLISDALTQTRLKNYQARMKNNVDVKGKNLEDINIAEENILARQEQADNTTIANLTLQDQIEFATITINLYQRQAVKREMVYTVKEVKGYEPSLGYKMKRSLLIGWKVVEAVILFTLKFWVFFVLAIAGFVFWRWWSRR